MMHGLDTGFLVAAEIPEHGDYRDARATLVRLLSASDRLALAPQVLAEFIHIVTDPHRFRQPFDVATAIQASEQWWTATEVDHVFPDQPATQQLLAWLKQFSLGRKRVLDRLLAATYHRAGIQSLLTTNPADFTVFGVFTCITPKSGAGSP